VYRAPGMQAHFRLVHDCMPTCIYWKYKSQTASTVQGDKNKWDLLARVIGAQLSPYWANS